METERLIIDQIKETVMPDKELVRFASACSAVAISHFPLPLHPPRLEEVQALLSTVKG